MVGNKSMIEPSGHESVALSDRLNIAKILYWDMFSVKSYIVTDPAIFFASQPYIRSFMLLIFKMCHSLGQPNSKNV